MSDEQEPSVNTAAPLKEEGQTDSLNSDRAAEGQTSEPLVDAGEGEEAPAKSDREPAGNREDTAGGQVESEERENTHRAEVEERDDGGGEMERETATSPDAVADDEPLVAETAAIIEITADEPETQQREEEGQGDRNDTAGLANSTAGIERAPKSTDNKQQQFEEEAKRKVSAITFHDLGYEVGQRKRFRKLPNKVILDSVSGELKTGVNAIMGPTGSGKTTLLDLLADRKDKAGKSGKVLINGRKRQTHYKTMVGYVVQDDVVMGTLSVRENLEFSAALRLPGHMTRAQRRERVEMVIETLGLYRCANTKVGTEFFRGVSGGERKRTNIGMELIIEPQVLFLDEPTTGLDAHTAVSVISLLKDLSVNESRMIVLSIHQPRYSIFKLFDSLTLLSQGGLVYHGPAQNALPYFDRLGYTCEEHENPADFFLDTIIQHEMEVRQRSEETIVFSKSAADDEEYAVDGVVVRGDKNDDIISKSATLRENYLRSEEYERLRERIDPVLQNLVEEKKKNGVARRAAKKFITRDYYATSFIWQLLIVTLRSVKNLLRSPQLSVFQVIFTSFLAIIIGIIFWQLDTQPNGFTDRIGVFFFIITNQSFGSLGAIQLFIQQKSLFIHENASGYYRVSAFFLSKILTDLIPLRFLPNLFFTIIVYFMIGFQIEADKFFIFWLILMMVNICAVSIAFFISAGVRNAEIANILIILPLIFSLLLAGLLISLDSLPVWVSWLRHFSFMKYGIEAFAINEMSGLRFQGPCQVEQVFDVTDECNSSLPLFSSADNCTSECAFDGLAQLGQLGYGNTTSVLWWDIFALVIYSTLFLILAYTVLRLIKKEK